MRDNDIVVAVYDAHEGAEKAIKELQSSGFDMKKLSIVGKNPHAEEHVVGFYTTGDRIKAWGKTGASAGAFWGGIWGLLFGAALFAIPGVGPVLAAGPIVAWIVGALEGAVVVGGVGAIGAGLYGIGLPKDSVLQYEVALKTDRYLLTVHGTPTEAARAHELLKSTHAATLDIYPLQHASPQEPEPVLAAKS